ncbi:homoserine O-acetyltransferase [Cladophialophora psammophila CBS 110553]|uniref:Homoserine O-acetyltransferase n=1 Tax=Cladophialophora psammophila CBS 110553 TaxID=1182543 RepID=W9X701_9EURO|nr:homoserine O-acetyltransferase [Cladophialophora psammophila CBS 110553]EXJ75978.1 homoserine O-acetyltransferase [Cladophialophora psammophila CBS 110553]
MSFSNPRVELNSQPECNYYTSLVRNLKTAVIPTFTLESGQQLHRVPIAYNAWGTLSEEGDNVLLICHALTGSSDVEDWWKPLIGRGKAVDTSRFFVICFNSLGSPYGSASPLSTDPVTGKTYGPSFPDTTFRDDVRIQKMVLDTLGVKRIASVIGGSMGGMIALEWPLCTPPGYVKTIIPVSTSAYQTAWGISWNTSQIRCIQADSQFCGGYYAPHPQSQPVQGLGAARMIGMLTYRSYTSFESRFGRRKSGSKQPSQSFSRPMTSLPSPPPTEAGDDIPDTAASKREAHNFGPTTIYSAQSYMQYQADKFLKRFDANCYIHLLRKMDSHDITRGRTTTMLLPSEEHPSTESVAAVLATCTAPALVVSIDSDLLFPSEQQTLLANSLPQAKLMKLDSSDGHDGFLLEMSAMEEPISTFLRDHNANIFEAPVFGDDEDDNEEVVTDSVFGELESF